MREKDWKSSNCWERFDLFKYNVIADSARDFCFSGEGNFGGKTICWRSQGGVPFACGF